MHQTLSIHNLPSMQNSQHLLPSKDTLRSHCFSHIYHTILTHTAGCHRIFSLQLLSHSNHSFVFLTALFTIRPRDILRDGSLLISACRCAAGIGLTARCIVCMAMTPCKDVKVGHRNWPHITASSSNKSTQMRIYMIGACRNQ